MSNLHTTLTTTQVTFTQPPPDGSAVVPNQQLQNIVTVAESEIDNPGTNQQPTPSSFPYGLSDPHSVNPNLSQFFPVNAPPPA